jgi:hypothetical protein
MGHWTGGQRNTFLQTYLYFNRFCAILQVILFFHEGAGDYAAGSLMKNPCEDMINSPRR